MVISCYVITSMILYLWISNCRIVSSGDIFDAFMILELQKGSLNGIKGRFYEDKVFEINESELEAFEKEFPFKEKHITDTQFK